MIESSSSSAVNSVALPGSSTKTPASAPAEIVDAEREKLAEYRDAQDKLSVALTRVRDAG